MPAARTSIRRRVAAVVGIVGVLSVVLSAGGVYLLQSSAYDRVAAAELHSHADLIAIGTNADVFFSDARATARVLDRLRASSEVTEAHMLKRVGTGYEPTAFASSPAGAAPRMDLLRQAPGIYHRSDGLWLVRGLTDDRGDEFAKVALRASMRLLNRERTRSLVLLAVVSLVMLSVSLVTAHRLHVGLTKPITSLAESVRGLAVAREPNDRVASSSVSELAVLGDSVNALLDAIEQHENALRKSEERYRLLAENVADVIWTMTLNLRFTYVSPSVERLLGWLPEDILSGDLSSFLPPETIDAARQTLASELERVADADDDEGRVTTLVLEQTHRDGHRVPTEILARLVRDEHGAPVSIIGVTRDLTERSRQEHERAQLEEQLAHAQKMESIGRLAGGIAHDLNNMLTPILGYGDILRDTLADPTSKRAADQIMSAAERSRDLVRQLLAFARKQALQIRVVDLGEIVSGFESMLRHTLREDIRFEVRRDPAALTVRADKGQVEQVILNLVVNAQDAMPDGGALVITTRLALHDEAPVDETAAGASARGYAVLVVEDTGAGMEASVMARAFEPFFTTKGPSQGTGLGLSTVYGIASQHGGHVLVSSEPTRGTVFRVFFPLTTAERSDQADPPRPGGSIGATSSDVVLIVEDQPQVLDLAAEVLASHGYGVLRAETVAGALAAAEGIKLQFSLILTDVVLPDGNGSALVKTLADLGCSAPAVYVSGYPADSLSTQGVLDAGIRFVQKPFSSKDLLAAVSSAIHPSSP